MKKALFRGKCIDNGKWVEGNYILDEGNLDNFIVEQTFDLAEPHLETQMGIDVFKVIPETVGQFTGLQDQYFKKIYYGDIVANKHGYRGIIKYGEFLPYEVNLFWEDVGGEIYSAFGLYLEFLRYPDKDDRKRQCFIGKKSILEVIGNIYENPELLKVPT